MAAPLLAIRPWTLAQSLNSQGKIDLSALTSPGGVFSPRQGETGADWFFSQAISDSSNAGDPAAISAYGQFYKKAQGHNQLAPTFFSDDPAVRFYLSGLELQPHAVWSQEDWGGWNKEFNTNTESYYAATLGIPNGAVNVGLRVPTIVAKRGQQRTAVFLYGVNSGVWGVTASIADGSSPSVALPDFTAPRDTRSDLCFAVDYTPGPDADSLVTVEVRLKQSLATYTRYLSARAAYITYPTVLRRSRGYREYLRSQGIFGGVYA